VGVATLSKRPSIDLVNFVREYMGGEMSSNHVRGIILIVWF